MDSGERLQTPRELLQGPVQRFDSARRLLLLSLLGGSPGDLNSYLGPAGIFDAQLSRACGYRFFVAALTGSDLA